MSYDKRERERERLGDMGRDNKKRSRAVEGGSGGGGGGGRQKRERETKGKDVESGSVVVSSPTEAEVDEFFAILRRMKAAVQYFGGGGKLTETLVTEVLPPRPRETNGVKVCGKKRGDVVDLDLNTIPEGE